MAVATTSNTSANVFASNIKLNGSFASVSNSTPPPFSISFILNEPATLGTTISILSGTNVVASLFAPSGSPGTLKGTNVMIWGGTNSGGMSAPGGTYSIAITPASSGYTNWTQITSDTNHGNYVAWPAGIAVDCNTNSLYYGRIMVANSVGNPNGGTNFGDTNGIIKLNADGSFADEGQGNAGYPFSYDGFNGDSPRRGRVAADDRFYFNDWTGDGKIVAVDIRVSTNQVILDSENFTGADVSGSFPEFDVAAVGTSAARAYLADYNNPGSVGLWSWPITNKGAADPVDDGIRVVTPGGTDIPNRAVYGLMLDSSNDIFIGDVQQTLGPYPSATCITNWPSSSNLPLITNNVLWQVGQSDSTFLDVSDLAIDSRTNPRFVACAMSGATGGLRILNVADGSLATNIQQGSNMNYLSVGWDNVGNVYAGAAAAVWRAFSPPGTNQSTTIAVPTIQITAPAAPLIITAISNSNTSVIINFTGAASDTPSGLAVYSSAVPIPASGYQISSAVIVQLSTGVFQATVAKNGAKQYYRIARL